MADQNPGQSGMQGNRGGQRGGGGRAYRGQEYARESQPPTGRPQSEWTYGTGPGYASQYPPGPRSSYMRQHTSNLPNPQLYSRQSLSSPAAFPPHPGYFTASPPAPSRGVFGSGEPLRSSYGRPTYATQSAPHSTGMEIHPGYHTAAFDNSFGVYSGAYPYPHSPTTLARSFGGMGMGPGTAMPRGGTAPPPRYPPSPYVNPNPTYERGISMPPAPMRAQHSPGGVREVGPSVPRPHVPPPQPRPPMLRTIRTAPVPQAPKMPRADTSNVAVVELESSSDEEKAAVVEPSNAASDQVVSDDNDSPVSDGSEVSVGSGIRLNKESDPEEVGEMMRRLMFSLGESETGPLILRRDTFAEHQESDSDVDQPAAKRVKQTHFVVGDSDLTMIPENSEPLRDYPEDDTDEEEGAGSGNVDDPESQDKDPDNQPPYLPADASLTSSQCSTSESASDSRSSSYSTDERLPLQLVDYEDSEDDEEEAEGEGEQDDNMDTGDTVPEPPVDNIATTSVFKEDATVDSVETLATVTLTIDATTFHDSVELKDEKLFAFAPLGSVKQEPTDHAPDRDSADMNSELYEEFLRRQAEADFPKLKDMKVEETTTETAGASTSAGAQVFSKPEGLVEVKIEDADTAASDESMPCSSSSMMSFGEKNPFRNAASTSDIKHSGAPQHPHAAKIMQLLKDRDFFNKTEVGQYLKLGYALKHGAAPMERPCVVEGRILVYGPPQLTAELESYFTGKFKLGDNVMRVRSRKDLETLLQQYAKEPKKSKFKYFVYMKDCDGDFGLTEYLQDLALLKKYIKETQRIDVFYCRSIRNTSIGYPDMNTLFSIQSRLDMFTHTLYYDAEVQASRMMKYARNRYISCATGLFKGLF